MSPDRTDYYNEKQRRMAFYIVENEKQNHEENPPTISAVIGLDKELEAAFFAARKPAISPAINNTMKTGMRINRTVISNNSKKNDLHCPNIPTQWKINLDVMIPKAEFGHFSPIRK